MKRIKLLFSLLSLVAIANAAVYYVSPAGSATTGNSWATAFNNIKQALDVATVGDEVWVAQGTYVIAGIANQLVYKNGVNVYGGFVGTETSREARSLNPALTIVQHEATVEAEFRLLTSADLDDAATFDGFTFDGNNASTGVRLAGNCTLNNAIVKNALVLNGSGAGVFMAGNELTPVVLSNTTITNNRIKTSTATTIPHGGAGIFVRSGSKLANITHCTIDGNTIEGISGMGTLEAMGAGIYIVEGKIQHSVINNNKLENSANAGYSHNNFTAGGIVIVPMSTSSAAKTVIIESCTVSNNTSPSRGGGIVIDPRWSGQYHGNYSIIKTKVINNRSGNVGGGLLATAATRQTGDGWTLNIVNSLFTNNSSGASAAGGAIFINASQILNITNTTIARNFSGNYGAGGLFLQGVANQTIKATLKNVLLWGNESPNRAAHEKQMVNGTQLSTIIFSAIQDFDPTIAHMASATMGDNIVLNADNAHASGPAFVAPTTEPGQGATGALTANWKLQSSSILIDAGDDFVADDIDGTARPQGDFSDIGAYEFSTATTNVQNAEQSKLKLYAAKGALVFNNDINAQSLVVYNLTGAKVASLQLKAGLNTLPLAPNQLYIVQVGKQTSKLMVR